MYRGEQVASVREFSDTLMFLLRARRPEAYRENATVRHEHPGRPSDEELAAPGRSSRNRGGHPAADRRRPRVMGRAEAPC